MGGVAGKAFRMRQGAQDIPQLTDYLANNPIFIRYSLKMNKNTNFGLSKFQQFLHEAAFPDDDNRKNKASKSNVKLDQNDRDQLKK